MDAKTLFTHGVRYHQNGDTNKAISLYRSVLQLEPMQGEAALYLALALQQAGQEHEAKDAYQTAIHLLPGDTDVLIGYGTVCFSLGDIRSAEEAHNAVLHAVPDSPEALAGLGNVRLAQGRTKEATILFQKAASLTPDNPDIISNLGVAFKAAGNPQEAVNCFEQALLLAPDSIDTLYNLGNAWQARGNMQAARQTYLKGCALAPNAVAPRWGACFSNLDMLYDDTASINAARERYELELTALNASLTLDDQKQIREAAAMVGANQPFFLTYQGHNDKDLQRHYGAMLNRIMAAASPRYAALRFSPHSGEHIRVGFATGFMHEHSVWKIPTRGWVKHLDRDRFAVFGYYTHSKDDHCTKEARQLFDKLTHEPTNFEALCQAIIVDRLDVLIFPDIGMDPTCAKLAALRLAPIQCVSLGHPMTTGLSTIDYFLSSDLMEPQDGDDAYTEQLVRLPNISVYYEPLRCTPPAFDRSHFKLPEDAFIYFCPQSLYKYLPQYDDLFPRIAQNVANARFLFILSAQADVLNERFLARIAKAFRRYELDAENFVLTLPYQGPEEYHALNHITDVFLDSIGWSGFNTAMEAANAGLPIITYPTGHMRGRHSHAVVQRLGLNEAVADSFNSYISLSIRAGTDPDFLSSLKRKMAVNSSHLLRDKEAIHGLEAFLETVAG